MNKTILSYTAGIFDGEGCVEIYKASTSKASKNPSFILRVTIVQKDGKVMNFLEDNFGGYVAVDYHNGYYIHRWDVRSKKAYRFLKLIYPFLVIKKDQVKVAFDFEEMKGKYLETLKGYQGFRRLTEEEVRKRFEIKAKLSALKKIYTPYMKNGAPTTTKRKDAK